MPAQDCLLGLDIGTTKLKAGLFSLCGEQLCSCHAHNDVIQNHRGCFEQDMDTLWNNIVVLITELLHLARNSADISDNLHIRAIGLTGQGEGLWLIDKDGKPVRNAILWNDVRSAKSVEELNPAIVQEHRAITGSNPCAGGTDILLTWLSIHEPDSLAKADCLLFCKDWIRFKLTGQKAIELSDASTSLIDLSTGKISHRIFELLGISAYRSLLPPLIDSYSIVGHVTPQVAALTGLCENIPVVAGCIDVVATAIGAGVIEKYDACSVLGTSCINEYIFDDVAHLGDNNAAHLCYDSKSRYICLMGTMTGMPNIEWAIKTFFSDVLTDIEDTEKLFRYLEKELHKTQPGANGVIYHPYISTSGERFPFCDSHARAGFFGITESCNRLHLLRAVYEGLAYSIKDCFADFTPERIFLAGGGSNDCVLVQIIADCLGVPVIVSDIKELGARGAAIIAGVGIGIFHNTEHALKECTSTNRRYNPNPAFTATYNEVYQLYKHIRMQYATSWQMRADMLKKIGIREGKINDTV